jgi:hypothetical protein
MEPEGVQVTPVPATTAIAPRIAALPPRKREAVERAARDFALSLFRANPRAK